MLTGMVQVGSGETHVEMWHTLLIVLGVIPNGMDQVGKSEAVHDIVKGKNCTGCDAHGHGPGRESGEAHVEMWHTLLIVLGVMPNGMDQVGKSGAVHVIVKGKHCHWM
jgi:hypothetical protein